MLKTKFGKRLFSLLLVLVCVFALASCGGTTTDPSQEAIADATAKAQEIHTQLIWDKTAMSQITSNVKGFINKTKYQNVTVEWESSEPDVLDNTGKVSLPNFDDERAVVVEEATEDKPAVKVVPVIVTATITAVAEWEINGKEYSKEIELEKEFKFTVSTIAEGTHKGTIADVKAAAATYIYDEMGVQRELVSNSSVIYNAMVEGVVTVVLQASGSGQFMIHDGTEGIYVYKTLDGLKAGDKVSVVGEIYSYYGSLQFGSNISVTVLEEGAVLDAEYRETTPQELEDEGAERNDKGLVKAGYYGGELVNVYGKLVKEAATGGSSDQYHVADAKTGEKLWIYYKSYDADMEETLKAFNGKYVNLRGVMYDRDSRLQKNEILWDGTIEEAAEPVLTDADKVAIALAAAVVPAQAEADFEVVLEEGYVWEVVSGAAIAFEGNVAKVTRGEKDEVVTIKLTVTVGEASDSKEFEVAVPAAKLNIITIAEAIAIAGTDGSYTEEKYYIQGIVTEVANDKYGNVYIKDETGSFYVYGMYSADGSTRYDAMEAKPQVGDLVTLYGSLGSYNGSPQMKNSWLAEYYDVVTLPEAVELAGTDGSYTEASYTIQGVVTEVANTKYGNLYVSDGTNSFYVYGLYDAQGNKYEAMEYQPQVGDFVTLNGSLGSYKGTPQMKNATLVNTNNPVSLAGAIFNAGTDGSYTDEMYIIKGVVTEIANEKYGNLYITDGENTFYVYGVYSADGGTRFDSLEVKPVVGQEIVIRGVLGSYNGTPQMKNGQLLVIREAETPVDPDQPVEHEHVACPTCGLCTDPECPGEAAEKCAGHEVVTPEAEKLVLTAENLGLGAYAAGSTTVDGIALSYTELGSYGDGIQWRQKNGNVASLWNTAALAGKIAKIEIVYTASKANYANANALKIQFGTDASVAAYETYMSTEKGVTLYTITPDAENYDFVKFTINITYSMYFESITIYYAGGSSETPVEPEHEHVACPTCGLCTDPECPGEAAEKCAGHEVPAAANKADFETINDGKTSSSYKGYTSTAGWVVANAAINAGHATADYAQNPVFGCLGGAEVRALTLNGKTSAPGSITSPVLENGVSKISFNYTNLFSDKSFALAINVKNEAGEVVATKDLVWTIDGGKYVVLEFVWELETAVEGKFVIEIVNKCPTAQNANKDRVTVWNVQWVNAGGSAPVEPDQPVVHEHVACPTCGLCTDPECPGEAAEKCAGHEVVTPEAEKLVLTAENLGLGAYAAGSTTVDGIALSYTELGSYGDGIQWRQKNGNVASLWNTAALAGKIAKIEIVYTASKANYSNANALKIQFGTDASVAAYETYMSTEKGVTLYTITPDAENYDFVKFTINITYSMYFESITIYYAE